MVGSRSILGEVVPPKADHDPLSWNRRAIAKAAPAIQPACRAPAARGAICSACAPADTGRLLGPDRGETAPAPATIYKTVTEPAIHRTLRV